VAETVEEHVNVPNPMLGRHKNDFFDLDCIHWKNQWKNNLFHGQYSSLEMETPVEGCVQILVETQNAQNPMKPERAGVGYEP
jgi:hypothetical protein